MKKIESRLNGLGKTVAEVVNMTGEYGEGSSIKMSNQLFKDCLTEGVIKSVNVVGAKGRGTKNIYCDCGEVVLVKLSKEVDSVAVFDKKLLGEDLYKLFTGKSMHIKRSKEDGRGIWRMSYPRVMHYKNELDKNGKKVTVIDEDYPVSVSVILWALYTGAITKEDLHSKNAPVLDITSYEAHHNKADWDNRIDATALMTTTAHMEYHSVHGQHSHQVIANPKTVEEVKALLKLLNNYSIDRP